MRRGVEIGGRCGEEAEREDEQSEEYCGERSREVTSCWEGVNRTWYGRAQLSSIFIMSTSVFFMP
jgi:hypothetical protein